MFSRLAVVLCFLIAQVRTDGTIIDLGLFTKTNCVGRPAAPYSGNASIGLGTCLATLGAVSIYVPTTACAGSDVTLYGYADSRCSDVDDGNDFYDNFGCYNWVDGAFGSIVLSCSTTSPGSVVSYTTVTAGPEATDPAGASSAAGSTATGISSGSTSSSGSNNDPSNSGSGWNSLASSTRSGIIGGGVAGVVLLSIIIGLISRHSRNRNQGGYVEGGYIEPPRRPFFTEKTSTERQWGYQ